VGSQGVVLATGIAHEGSIGMSDDPVDIRALDVATLSDFDVATLGDSVLGHAVRRVLAAGGGGRASNEASAIAAHDSHV
jgi:hypothetical protein